MSTKLLDEFSAAYVETGVDPGAVKAVYGQWVAIKLQSLSGLSASMQDDVVSGMVRDRCHEILNAPVADKSAELDADRIWTELWPLDQRAEKRAIAIKKSTLLASAEHDAALQDKTQLDALNVRIKTLPVAMRSQFADTVSESTLDIGYVLTGGSGPSSLRLGRSQ